MRGSDVDESAVKSEDVTKLGSARPRGAMCNRIEDRLLISWRTANDLQHLADRRLVLKTFLQLPRSRLHLLEEADVVDRDDSLICKGLEQPDLFIGERHHLHTLD